MPFVSVFLSEPELDSLGIKNPRTASEDLRKEFERTFGFAPLDAEWPPRVRCDVDEFESSGSVTVVRGDVLGG